MSASIYEHAGELIFNLSKNLYYSQDFLFLSIFFLSTYYSGRNLTQQYFSLTTNPLKYWMLFILSSLCQHVYFLSNTCIKIWSLTNCFWKPISPQAVKLLNSQPTGVMNEIPIIHRKWLDCGIFVLFFPFHFSMFLKCNHIVLFS